MNTFMTQNGILIVNRDNEESYNRYYDRVQNIKKILIKENNLNKTKLDKIDNLVKKNINTKHLHCSY